MATVRNPSFIELNGYFVEDEYARARISEIEAAGIDESYINSDFAKEIKNAYVTPQMFGAVGDGVTDDSQAFNNAFLESKNVFLPPGTYKISETVNIPNNGSLIGIDKNLVIIQSDCAVTFAIGERVQFEKIRANGNNENIFAQGNGYKLRLNDCYINEFDVGIDCTGGLMLSDIRNNTFRMLNKAFSIKNTSTVNVFDNNWCGYTNIFIANDKVGTNTIEAFNFTNCCFEGVSDSITKIRIFESDAEHLLAPRNIQFTTCYFEANGKVFSHVIGCSIAFDSCWFYYTRDHEEYYLEIYNHNVNFSARVSLNNCNLTSSTHGDVLIGESQNIDYFLHNVVYGKTDVNETNFLYDRVFFENNGFSVLYKQDEEIETSGTVEFDYSRLGDGKPHTYLITLVGAGNTTHWQCTYILFTGMQNNALVPLISKNCELSLGNAGKIVYTNTSNSYAQTTAYPFKIVATKLG